ncbi:hypothetical protein [Geothrix mesophila]|uniref:hypothetical protein n=1 Tax=Geothrix mesophila TaxID=2922723 RepID=UPI001FAC7BC2|nr:hypothetical protein [Geothrix sp. SG198]
MKQAIMATLMLCSVGCALPTTSVRKQLAKPVPQERILAQDLATPNDSRTEKVLIIRDSGFMGSGLNLIVFINKKPVAVLKPEEMVEFFLAPGKYMASVDAKNKVFNENPGESEIEIRKGEANNFRLRLIPGDEPRITRSEQLE